MKTKSYNPFDYLETQEEVNDYLNTAYMDDDPRIYIVALGYLARKKGMSKIAKKTGLNRESLYKSLSAKGNPCYFTINKISKALGCKSAGF